MAERSRNANKIINKSIYIYIYILFTCVVNIVVVFLVSIIVVYVLLVLVVVEFGTIWLEKLMELGVYRWLKILIWIL